MILSRSMRKKGYGEFMKRRYENKNALVLPMLMFFITIVLLIFGSGLFNTTKSTSFSQLDSGWSLSRGGKIYHDVSLSQFGFGNIENGEVITISRTIPVVDTPVLTMMFKSGLLAIQVEEDRERIYSFGEEYSHQGKFIPKKYHIIPLGDGSKEHDISITFRVVDKYTLKGLFPIYIGSRSDLIRFFFQYHRLSMFIGGFFIVYSLVLFSLGIFLFLYHRYEASVFISSAVSMLLGLYTYSYNDIFCFITEHESFFALLEYFTLYLIPLSFSVLLYSTNSNIAKIRQKMIIAINIILPICFWVSHFTGIMQINAFVIPVQAISVIEIITILPPLVKGARFDHENRQKAETYTGIDAGNYLTMGYICMIIFTLLEIAKYTFTRFSESMANGYAFSSINFLNLGMLFFIISLFIYYFLNGIDHMNADRVRQKLEGLAYTDALTGLMNRAKCIQYGTTLKGDYAVISLDLDRLKDVNDTFGHLEGDRMLKSFADLLVKSFDDASLIGRGGGDEFIVIYEDPTADVCDKGIRALEKNIEEFNKKSERFTISASAGYAYSYEVDDNDMTDVFYLADSRMYQMKEKHHEEQPQE